MSHLVETMMYCGREPWHQNADNPDDWARKLDAPPSCKEAIIQAGMDWTVEALPIYGQRFSPAVVEMPDGTKLRTPGTFHDDQYEMVTGGQVVRRTTDGRVLGVVGPNWTPVQNEDAFNFFDPIVQDGLALLHTAGSLNGGRTVWILAQIGNTVQVVGDDGIGQFLLLHMGHDGKRGINIMPTPIRVVCANTLGFAERKGEAEKTVIQLKHTPNVVTRMDEVRDFILPILHNYEQTVEVFKVLAKANAQAGDVELYLQDLFPDPEAKPGQKPRSHFAEKVRKAILDKFEGDLLGYEAIPERFRGTYWVLYNAVTEYVDHERGRDNTRLSHAWMGRGKEVKDRAFELALKMAS